MKKVLLSSEYLSESSREYAIYIAQTRAIPKIGDGLKDGGRKALWLMRNKHDKIKVIALSGQLISEELFVHGDSSASETISSIAAPYLNNFTYLEGVGFFGSKLGPDAWGAPRYVYVKKNKILEDLLLSDIDIVPMMDNYDGSNQSAETFLPLFPTVLLNGISGIAYGWSTEILPHKITDLIDCCLDNLEPNDSKKRRKIKPYYNKYDLTIEHIEDNSWMLLGKVEITDHNIATVTEIPPGIKLEKFKESLDRLEEADKIQSYIDKSKSNFEIRIQFKRGELKDKTEADLIELLKLRTRVSERIVVLDTSGKKIVQYEKPEDLVKDFVDWRLSWYTKRYEYLLDNLEINLRFCLAIEACFKNDFPGKLTKFKNKLETIEFVKKITSKLDVLDKEYDKIVSMPSYRWTKEYEDQNNDEIKRLKNLSIEYLDILQDSNKIKNIYKQELTDLRKKYV